MIRWAPKGSTENPMTFLLLLALWLFFRATSKPKRYAGVLLILSGFFSGLAFMIKQPAIFFCLTPVILQAYLYFKKDKWKERILSELILFATGYLIVLFGICAWLYSKGTLGAAIYNALVFPFTMQRDYGMSFDERWVEFVENGLLQIPILFALGATAMIVYVKKHSYENSVITAFILPVLLFLLWTGDFFQHYLIQLAPGLALGAALLLSDVFYFEKRWFIKTLLLGAALLFLFENVNRLNDAYVDNIDQADKAKMLPKTWLRATRDEQLDYQKMIGKYLQRNLKSGQKMVTTTPTYAYLAGVPNNYSQFYIAPLTQAASNDFEGLAEKIEESRYFVVEGWRTGFLPYELHMKIKDDWKFIRWLSDGECMDVEVWENPRFIDEDNSPAPLESPTEAFF